MSGYPIPAQRFEAAPYREPSNLADVLERVLDKGIVIAGDITIDLLHIELLTIKLRLLIASADKAREMGIDWWASDPYLSSKARQELEGDRSIQERVDRLERAIEAFTASRDGDGQHRGEAEGERTPAAGDDEAGR
jgi:hypothetical protein